jgi:hypothetical protein
MFFRGFVSFLSNTGKRETFNSTREFLRGEGLPANVEGVEALEEILSKGGLEVLNSINLEISSMIIEHSSKNRKRTFFSFLFLFSIWIALTRSFSKNLLFLFVKSIIILF